MTNIYLWFFTKKQNYSIYVATTVYHNIKILSIVYSEEKSTCGYPSFFVSRKKRDRLRITFAYSFGAFSRPDILHFVFCIYIIGLPRSLPLATFNLQLKKHRNPAVFFTHQNILKSLYKFPLPHIFVLKRN